MCRSMKFNAAIICAFDPARRCRSTVASIEGHTSVDESMITGEADAG